MISSYRVLVMHWTTTFHKTASGDTLWNIRFTPTPTSIVAPSEEQAIILAKQLGAINPILQKETHQ